MTVLFFVLGLGALLIGAELLVRGASRLAQALGITPLVVGLTVVAFGTSAPEMAVSVKAALDARTDIAVGNVVGSNIFNVLFILGLAAVITPLRVDQRLVRIDVPIMVGISLLLAVLAWDGNVGRLAGMVLFVGILAYTAFQVVQARRERNPDVISEYVGKFGGAGRPGSGVALQLAMVAGGLALLVLGSRWLVEGAVVFAQWMGVSEAVIGLTVVAAGTSLPEVAASVVASLRGERDIAVGNVVGSGIFNILGVLGLSAMVSAGGLPVPPSILSFDLPVMLAVAIACLPIFFTGFEIARWEGMVFLGYYVAYVSYLVLDTIGHDSLPMFGTAMLLFVLPLTALTLIVLVGRALHRERLG